MEVFRTDPRLNVLGRVSKNIPDGDGGGGMISNMTKERIHEGMEMSLGPGERGKNLGLEGKSGQLGREVCEPDKVAGQGDSDTPELQGQGREINLQGPIARAISDKQVTRNGDEGFFEKGGCRCGPPGGDGTEAVLDFRHAQGGAQQERTSVRVLEVFKEGEKGDTVIYSLEENGVGKIWGARDNPPEKLNACC
jgi:hypothetical protein